MIQTHCNSTWLSSFGSGVLSDISPHHPPALVGCSGKADAGMPARKPWGHGISDCEVLCICILVKQEKTKTKVLV